LKEEKDRGMTLERVEVELLSKLENSENSYGELKKYVQEVEEKLEMKGEAIEKAHKVI